MLHQRNYNTRNVNGALAQLADRVHVAGPFTILTSAGMPTASGIPTFRAADGLWKKHRPEQSAAPEAFFTDPSLIWEWYDWRRQDVARREPNRGHELLTAWSQRLDRFTLITQNVDGLHERAGTHAVIRFYGSTWELRCWNECEASANGWGNETVPLPTLPPHYCHGLTRPGVVWFAEAIEPAVAERSVAATK